jgi:hypothetical protein
VKRTTRNFRQDHGDEMRCVPDTWGYCPCPLETAPEDVAELVCSDTGTGKHLPVIDLDLPCRLVPSGTPGNFHLYIDQPCSFEQYMGVLESMAKAGIVQWGYVDATRERGFGSVRHPDRPKRVAA